MEVCLQVLGSTAVWLGLKMKKWNVLSCFEFWTEAISPCYHNTHSWPGAQQTVYVCITIHLLFSRTLSLDLQGRERGHVWASLLLKHKKDVVSALFSLSCPRKLPVDPPVVVSGLEPIADPHMKSFCTWMSHQMKHEANTCDSASDLLLHSLTLSCIATDWEMWTKGSEETWWKVLLTACCVIWCDFHGVCVSRARQRCGPGPCHRCQITVCYMITNGERAHCSKVYILP